jgi:dipeptidyl aminopeptidase/acylaminoacyl peptidase
MTANKIVLALSFALVLASACAPQTATPVDGTATQSALNEAATQTALSISTPTPSILTTTPPGATPAASPAPTETVFPTATELSQGTDQFLAYITDGQLLVTNVTNGVQGGTTQYTLAGESDQVTDLVWSPSGEFVAFVSSLGETPRLFYIFALGQSSPADLGPGSAPAWSPDSTSIAYIGGTFPNENIYVTTIESPAPRQLTFETNFVWGRPVFTPDGASLVVAGANRDTMGASGNTTFTLESLALDGSGTRAPLPGAAPFEGGRLPYDLRFSPDGSRLAFSTSYHWSACASPGAYYVSSPDGGNRQEWISPSLRSFVDPAQERFHVGLSYAWAPTGDALAVRGQVLDCQIDSPTTGQTLAGPQMSLIGLDGSERAVVPGFFWDLSMDRTGAMIAATHFQDGFQDMDPDVEIYSVQTGQLLLALGPGSSPQFQP